ncbi:MAG: glycosyltransferase family 2 protein, partial [Alphaproteobacteria bacterium]
TDGTEQLVAAYVDAGYPIKFKFEEWRGYAGQKQYAMELCSHDWQLSLDSDERMDSDFMRVLPDLLQAGPEVGGWRITRRPYLIGYGYTPKKSHERYNLRLVRKDAGAFDQTAKVHEGIVLNAGLKAKICKTGSMLHFRPIPIEEQILKENHYSSLKASMLIERGVQPRKLKMLINPLFYFLKLYFRTGLWRCGFSGFNQAMIGTVYSFLTETKIYEHYARLNHPQIDEEPDE